MGCICCKPSAIEDDSKDSSRERLAISKPVSSLRSEDQSRIESNEGCCNNDDKVLLIDKQVNNGSRVRLHGESFDRKRDKAEFIVGNQFQYHPASGTVPKSLEGEQVSAGWPTWLAAVAGEAIKGWVPRKADSFEKLDKVWFYVFWFLDFDSIIQYGLIFK